MTCVSPKPRVRPLALAAIAANILGLSLVAGCSSDGETGDGSASGGTGSGGSGSGGGGLDGTGAGGSGTGADGTGADGTGADGTGAGGSGTGGGGSGGSGSGGDGGSGGQPDTCPTPSAPFEVDEPAWPDAETLRDRAVLQVPTVGNVRVFAVDNDHSNPPNYTATLKRFEHDGPQSWSVQSGASGGLGSTMANSLAVTHGDDPCVAYIYDYQGTLELECDSGTDLTIAPSASSGVAIGEIGTAKLVVYNDGGATLRSVIVDPTADVPDTIDASWVIGATSMEIDSLGTAHLAYVAFEPGGVQRRVHYATRTGGIWSTETVADDDTWTGNPSVEGDSVSLALVSGSPVIAYHHRAERSLKMARRDGVGWATVTLDAPQPGYDNDFAGRSVALQVDCLDRLHVAYQRYYTPDVQPNLGLFYAQIVGDALVAPEAFPLTATPSFDLYGVVHGLSFFIDDTGGQFVAASIGGASYRATYFATR